MIHLKGKGHRIYIMKTPMYQDLFDRSTNVVVFPEPRYKLLQLQWPTGETNIQTQISPQLVIKPTWSSRVGGMNV